MQGIQATMTNNPFVMSITVGFELMPDIIMPKYLREFKADVVPYMPGTEFVERDSVPKNSIFHI